MSDVPISKGLSIDPNTKQTGLVWWRDDVVSKSETLTAGNWRQMAAGIIDAIHTHRLDLSWVAIEGVYQGPNPKVTGMLHRLVGCIELTVKQLGLRYYELSTAEVDKGCNLPYYAAGKRKEATAYFAYQNGHGEMDEHQADAFCVGFVIAQQERRRAMIDEAKGVA